LVYHEIRGNVADATIAIRSLSKLADDAITKGVKKAGEAAKAGLVETLSARKALSGGTLPAELTITSLVAAANRKRRGEELALSWKTLEFEMYARIGSQDARRLARASSAIPPLDASIKEINQWEERQRLLQEATLWAILYGFVDIHDKRLDANMEWVDDHQHETPSDELEKYWFARFAGLINYILSLDERSPVARTWMDLRRNPELFQDNAEVTRKRSMIQDFLRPLGEAAMSQLQRDK